jgi:hypothetical protein
MKTQQTIAYFLHKSSHAFVINISLMLSTFAMLSAQATEFDHQYTQYNTLLQSVVQVSENHQQTRVNYQELSTQSTSLNKVLMPISQVTKTQYDSWNNKQQLSFLINAYNAFTLKLIVNNWDEFKQGDAKSIRDLGNFFTNPWEQKFFTLLDKTQNLDNIEHKMIRKWFKQPSIHAALVCAAVSCPPLRNEAFTAKKLDEQLNSQMNLFLADNTRNEIIINNDNSSAEASISSIFKWYRGDFEKGDSGFNSLYDLLSAHTNAIVLGDSNQLEQRNFLKQVDYPITFKEYDWRLNDVANF